MIVLTTIVMILTFMVIIINIVTWYKIIKREIKNIDNEQVCKDYYEEDV